MSNKAILSWRAVTPEEKILLVLLPFWSTLIPPMGIACLKSHLTPHGFKVKTIDANVKEESRKIFDNYFDALKEYVPEEKQGNLYNIGFYIWQDHMMAHLTHTKKKEYAELVKILIYKTFYTRVYNHQVDRLTRIIAEHYTWLQSYVIDLLDKEKPAVLGLSVYSGTLAASLFTFKLAKERYPGIRTVMGGGVFSDCLTVDSSDLEFFLEKTEAYIDKIIIGEGEELFLKLLRGELPGSRRVHTLQDPGNKILDISRVEVPDLSDFDLQHYPHLASYASRSCPHQCSFCSEAFQWGPYRKKKHQAHPG